METAGVATREQLTRVRPTRKIVLDQGPIVTRPISAQFSSNRLAAPMAALIARRPGLQRSGGMRHRTIFDEGLFLVSFSVALGILAFVIPAHGASTSDVQVTGPSGEYVDLCDTGSDQPNCVAAVRFSDQDNTKVSTGR
jgi:hypothetical protein